MARAKELTEMVLDRIVRAVRAGVFPEVAAGFAEVPRETFRQWLRRGEKARRGKYRQLFEAVQRAEAESEVEMGAELFRAAENDPGAGFAALERRFAERWGRQRLGAPAGSSDARRPGPRRLLLPALEDLHRPAALPAPAPSSEASPSGESTPSSEGSR